MINYSKQLITKQDVKSVVNILRSNFLTQGPTVGTFENKILWIKICSCSQ